MGTFTLADGREVGGRHFLGGLHVHTSSLVQSGQWVLNLTSLRLSVLWLELLIS